MPPPVQTMTSLAPEIYRGKWRIQG
jgi:hypothetical protein